MISIVRKTIIIVVFALAPLLYAGAQEGPGALNLSLGAAVEHALSYNKSLQNARLEVERARRTIWESIAQGLPQVDGAVDYMTYFNYELAFSFGMDGDVSFTEQQLMEALNTTLSQPQFQGVTPQDILAHQAGNFYDAQLQSMLPPSTILMSDQSTAKVQISQLIFSGQYLVGIQTARLAQKISEQNLEFSELNIKESVINAYYLVLITEESLAILRQNLENMEQTLEQTRIMHQTGMAEKTDVDQIRITASQLENSIRSLERNVELNYNMLRFQLGLDADDPLRLTDDLHTLFTGLEPESALITAFNMENNIGYQIMKQQEEINKKLLSLEQWNYAPTLAGFYTYNAKILTTGFDMNPNHLAGLSLSVPIFSSGMRKARVDQARIDYNMSRINRDIMEDQLAIQEKQFRYNLQSALDNYLTQRENVDVAQSVYDSYRRKYEQGMASSLDLTQANGNYLNAESNYLTAMMEVMNARLQLDKLMNNL
jgi:outer membrane protein